MAAEVISPELKIENLFIKYQDSVVYKGTRFQDRLPVFVKTHLTDFPSTRFLANLDNEYKLLSKLDIPEILHPLRLVHYKTHHALVLEYFRGIPLKTFFSIKKFKLEEFYIVAASLVKVLGKLHQRKIIFKNINSSSLLIDPESLEIRFLDFSHASELFVEITDVLHLEGDICYIAPEQSGRTNRVVDYRSDFYSLGIIFFEMLTNQLPFQSSDPLELIYLHLTKEPPPIPRVPAALEKLVHKLMAKNAEDRYSSTNGILYDLQRLARGEKDFELGAQDIRNILSIPQKIYGREGQIQQILDRFQSFKMTGESELIVVNGYAGIGKSSLIHEIRKPLMSCKGIFIKGKYEIFQKHTPFLGLVQALKELVNYLLADEKYDELRQKIKDSLGPLGRTINDIVPDAALILGDLPPLALLSPQESQNRLLSAFHQFFRVIGTKEHPLIIFLDDLQEIDQSSLNLIADLLETTPYLFFLGTYLTHSIDTTNPLTLTLKDISKHTTITLPPLSQESVEELLLDTLGKINIQRLAQIIVAKTSGNPFFIIQFLNNLWKHGWIAFSEHGWSIDYEQIEKAQITDNVIELMAQKIQMLTSGCANLLSLAACIGGTFELKSLAIVTSEKNEAVAVVLWEAVQEGLIQTEGTDYKQASLGENILYRFVHDKIQEAAFNRISEKERKPVHLQIARHLYEYQQPLFEVIDQYNQALSLLEDEEEKKLVARLNIQAGKNAMASNAYQAALTFIEAARSLSEFENYEVEKEHANCLYFVGQFEESEKKIKELLDKYKSPHQLAEIYRSLIFQYLNLGKSQKAIATGIEALEILGNQSRVVNNKLDYIVTAIKTKFAILFVDKEKLKTREFNVAPDPFLNDISAIFFGIITGGYLSNNPLMFIIYAQKLLLHYLKNGLKAGGGLAPMIYAATLYARDRFDEAYFWLDVANREADAMQVPLIKGRVAFMKAAFEAPWFHPLRDSVRLVDKAIQLTYESGDYFYINYCYTARFITLFAAGLEIKQLIEESHKVIHAFHRSQGNGFYECGLAWNNLLVSLEQGEEKLSMEKIHKGLDLPSNQTTTHYVYTLYVFYLLVLEEYEKAFKIAKEGMRCEQATKGIVLNPLFHYFFVLASFKTPAKLTSEELELASSSMNYLKMANDRFALNYQHFYWHLMAEQASKKEEDEKAMILFEQALEYAEDISNSWAAAFISEGAFQHYRRKEKPRKEKHYLRLCCAYYEQWGALAKVQCMSQSVPTFFSDSEVLEKRPGPSTLDFASVMKASQALSQEIMMDHLLEKMLYFVQENAGAQRVVIILERGGELFAEAERAGVFVKIAKQSVDPSRFPLSVINYSVRLHKEVVLNNASQDPGLFQTDPYFAENKIKSVLCMPIYHHSKFIGLLYLENNLSSGVFVDERLNVLSTLASQIAISLENSRFFERLKQLYRSSERFVPKRFLEFLNKENIEDVALGDGIEQEVSVLFSDVRNFTAIVKNKTPTDTLKMINRYLEYMVPIIEQNQGFIGQYLGDGILAVFSRAEDAVNAGLAMLAALKDFNHAEIERGEKGFDIGIGINTGTAMLGIIGVKERLEPTFVSDMANTASRVESLNKTYHTRLLINEFTLNSLTSAKDYRLRRVDKVILQGKDAPTSLFEVVDWGDKLESMSVDDYLALFSEGFKLYEIGDFESARRIFLKCRGFFPKDRVTEILLCRCEQFIDQGSPTDWNGTFMLMHK